MAYLHKDTQTFNAAVVRSAEALHLPPAVVAKDYFVYIMLKEISVRYPNIIFKGGTALSKCHGVIRRFSEDIDLGVETVHLSQGQRRKVKASIVDAAHTLGLHIINLDETHSRRNFNRYIIELPFDVSAPGLSKNLIVETAFMTPVSPNLRLPTGNFIYDCYSALSEGNALFKAFDLAPFNINVTSITRAFIDKVFALCDYYLSDKPADRCSRHIYDEFKLLPLITLNNSMAELFMQVRNERRGLPFCPSAEPSVNLAATLYEIIQTGYYESDYHNVTRDLLWENVPYEQAISALKEIADFLSSNIAIKAVE